MGSASSKAAQGAARKYPTRAPGSAVPPSTTTSAGRPAAAAGAAATATAAQRAQAAAAQQQQHEDNDTAQASSPSSSSSDVTADFSARLRQMGIAQPNPTYSPSSMAADNHGLGPDPAAAKPSAPARHPGGAPVYPTAPRNATLSALDARRALERRADAEFEGLGRQGSEGREFLDANTIVQMHVLRARGVPDRDIEARFDLKRGVVARLGPAGVTVPASVEMADEQPPAARR